MADANDANAEAAADAVVPEATDAANAPVAVDAPREARTASASTPKDAGQTPGILTLRLIEPFAWLALVGGLLGRGIAPSLGGVFVGMDAVVVTVDRGAAAIAQILAMSGTVIAMTALLLVARSKLPAWSRFVALGLGGVVLFASLSAAADRLHPVVAEIVGVSAGLLAIGAAVLAVMRARFAVPTARVVACAGLGALLRVAAVGLAVYALNPAHARVGGIARGFATAAFVADAGAIAMAMTWLSARAKRMTSPATIVVLLLALLATRMAITADQDDAGAMSLLLRRVAEQLSLRPEPFIPQPIALFTALLAPLTAAAVLILRGAARSESADPQALPIPGAQWLPVRGLGGAVALALLVRGAADVPLCSLGLLVAALSLALATLDQRALWSALPTEKAPKEREANARTGDLKTP